MKQGLSNHVIKCLICSLFLIIVNKYFKSTGFHLHSYVVIAKVKTLQDHPAPKLFRSLQVLLLLFSFFSTPFPLKMKAYTCCYAHMFTDLFALFLKMWRYRIQGIIKNLSFLLHAPCAQLTGGLYLIVACHISLERMSNS